MWRTLNIRRSSSFLFFSGMASLFLILSLQPMDSARFIELAFGLPYSKNAIASTHPAALAFLSALIVFGLGLTGMMLRFLTQNSGKKDPAAQPLQRNTTQEGEEDWIFI